MKYLFDLFNLFADFFELMHSPHLEYYDDIYIPLYITSQCKCYGCYLSRQVAEM